MSISTVIDYGSTLLWEFCTTNNVKYKDPREPQQSIVDYFVLLKEVAVAVRELEVAVRYIQATGSSTERNVANHVELGIIMPVWRIHFYDCGQPKEIFDDCEDQLAQYTHLRDTECKHVPWCEMKDEVANKHKWTHHCKVDTQKRGEKIVHWTLVHSAFAYALSQAIHSLVELRCFSEEQLNRDRLEQWAGAKSDAKRRRGGHEDDLRVTSPTPLGVLHAICC